MIGKDPGGVLRVVLIEMLTLAGDPVEGETVGGVNLQVAPAGKPLQARLTTPLNEPDAVTERLIGGDVVPRGRLIVEGAAVARLKSTTRTCTFCLCVVAPVSEPVPIMLKEKSWVTGLETLTENAAGAVPGDTVPPWQVAGRGEPEGPQEIATELL